MIKEVWPTFMDSAEPVHYTSGIDSSYESSEFIWAILYCFSSDYSHAKTVAYNRHICSRISKLAALQNRLLWLLLEEKG